jgi:hypothetical protein
MLELLSNLNGMWKKPWWLIWFWPFLVLENWKKKEKGYKMCLGLGLVGNLSGIVLVWDERRLTKNPLG